MYALFAALLLVPAVLRADTTETDPLSEIGTEESGPSGESTGGEDLRTSLDTARAYVDSLRAALDTPDDDSESTDLDDWLSKLRSALDQAEVEGLPERPTDGAIADDAEGGLDWLLLAVGGASGLLLGLGAGWLAWGRRQRGKESRAPSGGAGSHSFEPTVPLLPNPDRGRKDRTTPVAQDADLKEMIRTFERAMTGRLDQIERKITSAPPPRSERSTGRDRSPTPKAPSRVDSQGTLIGAAFASWCREAGPAVSERAGFAARLAEAVPGASVRPIYRDRDSARLPVVFSDDEGRSPAEYWAVEGAGGPWLLPFPQGPRQFRDLADGTFDGGTVAPRSLQSATPARLQPAEGGGYAVAEPGRLA